MSWTVGEPARLAGVTVRTLPHYPKDPAAPATRKLAAGPCSGAEGDDVERRSAEALADGVPAESATAMDLADEHRQQEKDPPAPHASPARRGAPQASQDERFTAHYEQVAPGLAQYVSTAVQADAARRGG